MTAQASTAQASKAEAAAALLIVARTQGSIADLPAALRPANESEAYAVQAATLAQLGPVGGFKVGASGPAAPPSCAPIPLSALHASPAVLPSSVFVSRGIESEIAFVLATDLPPRATPYGRDEVVAAIASAHPGIEVLQSRFTDPDQVDPLCRLADGIQHGAYVLGQGRQDWHGIDFAQTEIWQHIGNQALRALGNPCGDMIRLVQWLANGGAAHCGGLRAGQVVTCGSWTGKTPAGVDQPVRAEFAGFTPVALTFT